MSSESDELVALATQQQQQSWVVDLRGGRECPVEEATPNEFFYFRLPFIRRSGAGEMCKKATVARRRWPDQPGSVAHVSMITGIVIFNG
jgi:hypothetical protein